MQRLFGLVALVAALAAVMVYPALAASPGTTGQPSQSCLSSTALIEPGQAASAPGSALTSHHRRIPPAELRVRCTPETAKRR